MPRAASHIGFVSGLALACCLGSAMLAQSPADVRVERNGATARIILDYDDSVGDARPTASAAVEYSVLLVDLSEAMEADISGLAEEIGDLAARARLDADGATLRIALTGPAEARISSSYDLVAIDIAPPGTPPLAPRPRNTQGLN